MVPQQNEKKQATSREKISILLTSEPNYDEFAFKYFLLNLNKIQTYYEFLFPDIHKYYYSEKYYAEKTLFERFKDYVKPTINSYRESKCFINIITSTIEGNLFFTCGEENWNRNVAFITTDRWEKDFSPPSLFEYLLHSIVACLLCMNEHVKLPSHENDVRGCCSDYCWFKDNDKVDITLGYVCDKCRDKITTGTSQEYLSEIIKILDKNWIGSIDTFGSVAHNLKKFFRFDIDKDSGFKKTFWDKTKEHFYEVPAKVILLIAGAVIGSLVTLLVDYLFTGR